MDEDVDISEDMWSYVDNTDFLDGEGIDARTAQLKEQVERLEVPRERKEGEVGGMVNM